ncbi:MAG: AraC family ligand binding domain-containing protein [Ornithinimicrobium sp.]
MAEILQATPFPVPGGKAIHEMVGRISSGHTNLSIAHSAAEPGWSEPGQSPEFDEVTYVIAGSMELAHKDGTLTVEAGQAALSRSGDWVRYSAGDDGAEYLAICIPAFDLEACHRDD